MVTRKSAKKKSKPASKTSSARRKKTTARSASRPSKSMPRPKMPKAPAMPKGCSCGSDCHDDHAHLPGYLLVALGALAAPINFGIIPMLEWAKAWPLLLVLFGFVYIVKTSLCRKNK